MELPLGASLKNGTLEFEIIKVVGDSLLTADNEWLRWRDDEQLLIDFYFIM
ncbi:hypothetical protein [Parapedobacter tibetensis]|uniref:hypothetical protein n=1 Tax=Parapedobacter tibetensis TaxID=2972951 RepID=UPI00214D27FB|nr:hypothetical protein [Parapedobacter tibetensis]